jgi:hypothetical protein
MNGEESDRSITFVVDLLQYSLPDRTTNLQPTCP